jgi:two-component system chemotaxis response regulator CheB
MHTLTFGHEPATGQVRQIDPRRDMPAPGAASPLRAAPPTFTRPGPPMLPTIRVAVVGESALLRGRLTEIINRQPGMICVGSASEALAARELLRGSPDVVVLDAEMTRTDGLELLSRLMRLRPTPVVMLSSPTEHGAEVTLKALEMGALDVAAKPPPGSADGMRQLGEDVIESIRALSTAQVRRTAPRAPNTPKAQSVATALGARAAGKVIFIGASTGGTEATRELLSCLPADTPAVLIAQHLPAGFTHTYAERLNAASRLRVSQACDGERVQPGCAYVAPGGQPMWIERAGDALVVRIGEPEAASRRLPLVERLFESAARVVGTDAIGLILTGSGTDGATAMHAMRRAGAWNLAQNESSCVAFGMPREAIACGAVHETLPLQLIAPRLLEHLCTTARPAETVV